MRHKKKPFCVLVLAAGKGTRMYSKTPKVLQSMLEEPLLYYPLSAITKSGFNDIAVMVGFSGETVEAWLSQVFPDVKVLWQKEQLGTGHAAKLAQNWWSEYENVMILPGDTPLITSDTIRIFAEKHISGGGCSFLSFELENPYGYGRVIREGTTVRIVEQNDASDEEKKCREVNSGMYIFNTGILASVIDKIQCENIQKEYYLPDALLLIQNAGGSVDAVKVEDPSEFLGVNDPRQLAEAAAVMRGRILDRWMLSGVKCMDPLSTWIGPKAVLAEDVIIEPSVQIWGTSYIGAGSRIGSFTTLRDAELEENVTIVGSVRIKGSKIGRDSSVGPFVFIRDKAVLADDVHVGRFVEIKNSTVSSGAKVPHLSYIGDAEIGRKTNIGAGTITCNYDGEKKNRTIIGDNCFIGSDTMLVAPVVVGSNSTTAAGSVITEDVPEGALGVARARQKNIEGWYLRKKNIRGGN
ncbi:MAG: bifunctional UDP-N-acetylglucosamine diphosphorylase/glucosamine-1-phosphate N-acetyltransferase GlmU [Synergistaceae bacterium]|nr:bifunctional UDP-N-acetylglucosamine diphosphorylase/glucosamine-1-phosphate N-acetyltransferase GlmU [Synergistaceae bacterium]